MQGGAALEGKKGGKETATSGQGGGSESNTVNTRVPGAGNTEGGGAPHPAACAPKNAHPDWFQRGHRGGKGGEGVQTENSVKEAKTRINQSRGKRRKPPSFSNPAKKKGGGKEHTPVSGKKTIRGKDGPSETTALETVSEKKDVKTPKNQRQSPLGWREKPQNREKGVYFRSSTKEWVRCQSPQGKKKKGDGIYEVDAVPRPKPGEEERLVSVGAWGGGSVKGKGAKGISCVVERVGGEKGSARRSSPPGEEKKGGGKKRRKGSGGRLS